MKRSDLTLSAVLVPVDVVMLVLAAFAAYSLRFSPDVMRLLPVQGTFEFSNYSRIVVIAVPFWVIVYALAGMYALSNIRTISQELMRVVFASSTAVMLLIAGIFFQRELFSSRFIILAAWGFAIVFVFFARQVVRFIHRSYLRRGKGLHRVVVFGADRTTDLLLAHIRENPLAGFSVVAHFPSFANGDRATIEKLLEQQDVDEIMLADPMMPTNERMDLLDFANEENRTLRYAADLFETKVSKVDISTIGTIPFFEVKRTPLDGWGRIAKRSVDIVGSMFGLIVLSPLFFAVASVIKITSNGPVFVALWRVGQRGKKFQLYKFRSMVTNAHELKKELLAKNERGDGPLFKMSNDPRVTPFGRFLRKSTIDELPQLWNVLKGNMSLIGPRPHEPEEVAQYKREHKQVLFVRPGMTGMAQVSGRSELKFDDEVRLDVYYIENWSLGLDLQILLKTFWVVLTRYSESK